MSNQSEIELQILVCDDMIRHYKSERKKLIKRRTRYNVRQKYLYQSELGALILFLSQNPGSDKKAIAAILPELSTQELSNLLVLASRNRGIIKNSGTRAQPRWFLMSADEVQAHRN